MCAEVIDLTELLERVENDHELLLELIDIFLQDCPQKIQAMRRAADAKEYTQLQELAHSLKGASGNISAKAMRELFLEIENMAKAQDASDMQRSFDAVDAQHADLQKYFPQLKAKLST